VGYKIKGVRFNLFQSDLDRKELGCKTFTNGNIPSPFPSISPTGRNFFTYSFLSTSQKCVDLGGRNFMCSHPVTFPPYNFFLIFFENNTQNNTKSVMVVGGVTVS